jgi:glycosyltransferase involved in cell wall biosynthesis
MKIVIVHNRYALPGRGSGEEVAIDAISRLLKEKGHSIVPYIRSSLEVPEMKLGRLRAFFTGIYNVRAKREMEKLLDGEKPDLVYVQNLFPLISPSVLVACRKANVPVVMRCPNYRLMCPGGLFMTNGILCERCSGGREYWCILKNCEKDIFKSMGYALRAYVARQFSLFKDNVDIFMVLTEFAKRKLIQNGFSSKQVRVISGLANPNGIRPSFSGNHGYYAGFVGRVSPEKGIDLFIEAAKRLPKVPFKVAGNFDRSLDLVRQAPQNIEFTGQLDPEALMVFYAQARTIVAPSKWYEGLPMAVIEAMLSGKPVICSDIGGLPEVVDDGITGLLFHHDDAKDLAEKIQKLWNDQKLCRIMGIAAREKAEKAYSPDVFYQRFMNACESAIKNKHELQPNSL